MRAMLERARYLGLIAVVGLFVMMLTTFGWAVAKSVQLLSQLITGGWRKDLGVVDLLEVIDTYLLGIVQLIVVIGLYELFVGPLDIPAWLKARSLGDLKRSIIDVLIVFIGVKGLERLVAAEEPLDALAYAGAVAVLIGALSLFRIKGPPDTTEPSSATAKRPAD